MKRWKRWATVGAASIAATAGLSGAVLLASPVVAAAAASTPSAIPAAPFVETVVPEGLGVLVNWAPNADTDQVTDYTVTPAVACCGSTMLGRPSRRT